MAYTHLTNPLTNILLWQLIMLNSTSYRTVAWGWSIVYLHVYSRMFLYCNLYTIQQPTFYLSCLRNRCDYIARSTECHELQKLKLCLCSLQMKYDRNWPTALLFLINTCQTFYFSVIGIRAVSPVTSNDKRQTYFVLIVYKRAILITIQNSRI